MTIKRAAFVSFFSVYPPKFGSAIVSKSFFESWPDNNKKLFQFGCFRFSTFISDF